MTELEEIGNELCWELLGARTFGRLAVIAGGWPEIYPVNYAAVQGVILVRTVLGRKLDHASYNPVCFEIDDYQEGGGGFSVLVRGTGYDITDAPDDRARALRDTEVDSAAPGPRDRWLAIYADEVTGRALRTARPAGREG